MNPGTAGVSPAGAAPALPAALRLGAVHLTVSDLDRSVAWYARALGLRVHGHGSREATLGDGARPLVVLHEDPLAMPAGAHTGLYHYAVNYPTRDALGRAAARLATGRISIDGATRHPHHDGIYLPDPDGNGIELAWDHTPGHLPGRRNRSGRSPLDLAELVALGRQTGVPAHADVGMRVGHLHLFVGDLDDGLAFYRDLLGFDDWSLLGGMAAFVAVGGYHHHLAFNTGRGGDPAPEHRAGLRRWTIELPAAADVDEVRSRVVRAGLPTESVDGGFLVRDPWGIATGVVPAGPTPPPAGEV